MKKDFKQETLDQSESRIAHKLAALETFQRADSNGLAFAKEALEEVDAKVLETLFGALRMTEFVPFDASLDAMMEVYSYDMETETGAAKDIHRYTDERPSVDTFLQRSQKNVREGGASYQYRFHDPQKGQILNYNHVIAKAKAAARAIARWHEDFAFSGRADHNQTGFVNEANVPVVSPTTGSWTTGTTADQMYGDLAKLVDSIASASLENHDPDTLALGLDTYNLAKNKYFGTDTNNSVLKRIRDEFPGLTIMKWNRLNTAGASSKSRAIAYKKDPDVLVYKASVLYDEFPPVYHGSYYDVQCYGRAAGMVFYRPKACAYMDLT